MVLVLLATRVAYPSFGLAGRTLAWLVIVGGVAALAALGQSILRLYVRPALADGRARRRKRNP